MIQETAWSNHLKFRNPSRFELRAEKNEKLRILHYIFDPYRNGSRPYPLSEIAVRLGFGPSDPSTSQNLLSLVDSFHSISHLKTRSLKVTQHITIAQLTISASIKFGSGCVRKPFS